MKIKVNEATQAQLNWMVAKCEELLDAGRVVVDFEYMSGHDPIRLNPRPDVYYSSAYSPSTDWAYGGPIIEREGITIARRGKYSYSAWGAVLNDFEFDEEGPTPLIAAMRCYVASHLGDEVDIPAELV